MKLSLQNNKRALVGRTTKPFQYKKFQILVSYAFLLDDKANAAAILNDDRLEVMLDSGAYTAYTTNRSIDIHAYMKFVEKWQHRLFCYSMLDVIGDPKTTAQNLIIMLDAGFIPVPVHVRGDTEQRMDELFALSDYVALNTRGSNNRLDLPAVHKKMQWARGRQVHLFGTTDPGLLQGYNPYSCDSSTSQFQATAFGLLRLYVGNGTILGLSRKEYLHFRKRSSIQKQIKIFDTDLDDATCWDGKGGYPLLSYAFYADALRQKYYAALNGTRIFSAILPGQYTWLREKILDKSDIIQHIFL